MEYNKIGGIWLDKHPRDFLDYKFNQFASLLWCGGLLASWTLLWVKIGRQFVASWASFSVFDCCYVASDAQTFLTEESLLLVNHSWRNAPNQSFDSLTRLNPHPFLFRWDVCVFLPLWAVAVGLPDYFQQPLAKHFWVFQSVFVLSNSCCLQMMKQLAMTINQLCQ